MGPPPSRAAARGAVVLALVVLGLPSTLGTIALTTAGPVSPGGDRPVAWMTDALRPAAGDAIEALRGATPVDLEVTLAPNDPGGLAALVHALGQPSSPTYRHFLSESAFEARFAPPASHLAALETYFRAHGATAAAATPDGLGLRVSTTAAGARAALGITYVDVRGPSGAGFTTALGAPHLPSAIAGFVGGIGGLSDLGPSAVHRNVVPVVAGPRSALASITRNTSSGQWWFTGTDFAMGYHEENLLPPTASVANATFATNEAVATILMSGYNNSTSTNLPPFDPAVVDAYYNDTFPNATVQSYNWTMPSLAGDPITIDGVSPPLPASYHSLSDDSLDEAENSLDLEMAGSFAPGAQLDNFYFAASLANGGAPSGPTQIQNVADDFAECLSQALSHPYGSLRLAAVTNSYGLNLVNDSLWYSELQHAEVLGVTVVAASGDQGNAPPGESAYSQGAAPTWPATAAYNDSGVVAVGGTTVNLTGNPAGQFDGGNLSDPFDPTITGISSEAAWYDARGGAGHLAGTEGGISPDVAEPYWQFHSAAQPGIAAAAGVQGTGALGRAEPDLAFPANATLAYVSAAGGIVYFELVEGTSIASPIFAGMLAELSAVSGTRYGFLDPELYRIGSYYAANPSGSDPLVDVANGSNYEFTSAVGWDPLTGWGTLRPTAFLVADANTNVSGYVYSGPTPGAPSKPAGPGNPLTPEVSLLVLVVLALAVVFAVLAILRGSRPSASRPYPPTSLRPGTYTPTPGGPPPPFTGSGFAGPGPPATFLCPYCGSVRPAEPVRCPACGAF